MTPARRSGLVLLAGAAAFAAVFALTDLDFVHTPLVLGLAYGAAALAAREHFLGPALVLVGWGIAVALRFHLELELEYAGASIFGIGAGALAATRLDEVRWDGVAATMLVGGAIYAFQGRWDAVTGWELYAGLAALQGLVVAARG